MTSPTPTDRQPGLAAAVALYTAARVGLVAVVTALLVVAGVPFLLALLIALIVALPLSMVLFRGLRSQLENALGAARERRAREREALRAKLRGDEPPTASDEPADRESDRGQD
ncbi:MAG TPA: DUF4229 domain-containing protein [Pseudonocardia sp.]|jgi:uncharacterized protein (DUF58 family)|uniref:DUF4229 domain-containing protein n=1 Tax=Pseudonocardia sp. TaxID=60912 RepID=UPI002B4ACB3F|nr:DUF4229 domain-containing protein [Pseudonocardia sp.]HLU55588.1 DUF4229 domain-containing protein [Pseudonocardia sp.]